MDTPPPPPNPEPSPEPVNPPPTPVVPIDPKEKPWIVALHLSPLVGLVFPSIGSILAPLLIWLIKKPEMPSLEPVGREVLNFQISFAIYLIASAIIFGITSCLIFTIILPIAVYIAWLVLTIIGGVKASNGESYVYPLTIKML